MHTYSDSPHKEIGNFNVAEEIGEAFCYSAEELTAVATIFAEGESIY